ncbi:MAG TPA: EscU/YscU/HrcU family type III secretion system export apparatus switch protein [Candidatus Binatus sp.]|nr:EscU/YscU/HrcU family type III secretion system export apparatus switch protein [Candidatus Binatus sp.]
MSANGERSEAPTPKRLAKARAKGRWPSSPCTALWISLALVVIPTWFVERAVAGWVALWRATAAIAADSDASAGVFSVATAWAHWRPGWTLVSLAWACSFVAAFVAAAGAGALAFAPSALLPRADRLSWRIGIAQLISSDPSQALIASITCAVAIWCAWPLVQSLMSLASAHAGLVSSLAITRAALVGFWIRSFAGFGLIAIADSWRIRTRARASLAMTASEVRDERAESEGRPEVRARQRSAATRMTRNIDIAAIARATAVVANPTHVAVALHYAPPVVDVPLVVSRGADLGAVMVRSIAALNEVPIIESPELARKLYARSALNEPIPEECFAAVAAVFAFILQTRGTLRGAQNE